MCQTPFGGCRSLSKVTAIRHLPLGEYPVTRMVRPLREHPSSITARGSRAASIRAPYSRPCAKRRPPSHLGQQRPLPPPEPWATPIRYLATDLGDGQRILVVGDLEDARDQALRIAFLIAAAGLVYLITGALVTSWAVNRAMRPLADLTASAAAVARESTARLPVITEPAEIAALSTSINDLLDQLDAEHRRRTRFLATVSHEVRTH
jgi:signal transduction histidine kinase